jgi:hypothetical protein
LSACGGGDDDAKAKDDKANDTTADAPSGKAADAGFCRQVVSLLTSTNQQPGAQALAAARKLDPPAELSGDWNTWLDGITSLGSPGASFNPNDPAKAGEYQKIYAATQKVFTYIEQKCGLGNIAGASTTTTGTG